MRFETVRPVACVVDEAEQVRRERRACRDAWQVGTLLLLFQPYAWQLHQAQVVGLVLGEPAQDVRELAA